MTHLSARRFGSNRDRSRSYRALSYCWGSNIRNEKVLVVDTDTNVGSIVMVTANLHAFLIVAESLGIGGWMFIDAICINQDDLEERAQQVPLMGKIYQAASLVTIWLGQENAKGERLLTRLSSVDHRKFRGMIPESRRLRREAEANGEVEALTSHPYWTRVWVVPEFLHARRAEIRLGSVVAKAEALELLKTNVCCDSKSLRDLSKYQKYGRSFSHKPLIDLVVEYGKHECSDPRDKVFALISLSTQAHNFPVDYSIAMEEILFRLDWSDPNRTSSVDDAREALKISPEDLLAHASRLKNGRDTFVSFPEEKSVHCHPSFSIPLQQMFELGIESRAIHYLLHCACKHFYGTHILFADCENPDLALRWVAVGLLSNGGILETSSTTGFPFPWKSAIRAVENERPTDLPIWHDIRLSVTRYAFAVLLQRGCSARTSET